MGRFREGSGVMSLQGAQKQIGRGAEAGTCPVVQDRLLVAPSRGGPVVQDRLLMAPSRGGPSQPCE